MWQNVTKCYKCDQMWQVWQIVTSVTKPERYDNTWNKRQNDTGVKKCDKIEKNIMSLEKFYKWVKMWKV